MFAQLNRSQQDELHKQYRKNDLFRQWSPLLSRMGFQMQELDVVTLWCKAEGVINELKEMETERDEVIVFLFSRLMKDFKTIMDENGELMKRTDAQAECSAVAVMCMVLTLLMNSVEKGKEDEEFEHLPICIAIMGLLRSHPYFQKLMGLFFDRKLDNRGNKVVFTPHDPLAEESDRKDVNQGDLMESPFMPVMLNKEKGRQVIALLHKNMDGKTKSKDLLRPVRAAMDAGAIRRPTMGEMCAEFGTVMKSKKTSISKYTDPQNTPFDDEQYIAMKKVFADIIR